LKIQEIACKAVGSTAEGLQKTITRTIESPEEAKGFYTIANDIKMKRKPFKNHTKE
jgi:hypothetical protein